jgi:hypothetical protein
LNVTRVGGNPAKRNGLVFEVVWRVKVESPIWSFPQALNGVRDTKTSSENTRQSIKKIEAGSHEAIAQNFSDGGFSSLYQIQDQMMEMKLQGMHHMTKNFISLSG